MVANTHPFYVLRLKDSGKEKIYKIDFAAAKWQPRIDRDPKHQHRLAEATYVNGVPFFEGWYRVPFWRMKIVDKHGNFITPIQPHGISEAEYDMQRSNDSFGPPSFGDDITAAQMDIDNDLPPLFDLDLNDDVDEIAGNDVPVPIAALSSTSDEGGSSGD